MMGVYMQFPSSLPPGENPAESSKPARKAEESRVPHPTGVPHTTAPIHEGRTITPLVDVATDQSSYWLDSLGAIACTVGSTSASITTSYVIPSLKVAARVGVDIATLAQASYVEKKSLSEAVGDVVISHLENSSTVQNEVESRSKKLVALTGSTACSELCEKLAARMVTAMAVSVAYAHAIPENQRTDFQKNLVQKGVGDNPDTHNFQGNVLSYVLAERFELMQGAIQANILTAVSNIISYLKEQQRQNPFYFHDLLKDVLDEATSELKKLKPSSTTLTAEEEKELVGKLSKIFSKKFMEIACPHREKEIFIPIQNDPVARLFISKEALFKVLETELVPELIVDGYARFDLEERKDETALSLLQTIREALSEKETKGPATVSEKRTDQTLYPRQEAFNKSLSKFTLTMLSFLFSTNDFRSVGDKADNSLLRHPIEAFGPLIVRAILQVDLLSSINQGAEGLLHTISHHEENPSVYVKEHAAIRAAIDEEFRQLASSYDLFRKAIKRGIKESVTEPAASNPQSLIQDLGQKAKRALLTGAIGAASALAKHPAAKRNYKLAVTNVEKAYKQTSAKQAITSVLSSSVRIRKLKCN